MDGRHNSTAYDAGSCSGGCGEAQFNIPHPRSDAKTGEPCPYGPAWRVWVPGSRIGRVTPSGAGEHAVDVSPRRRLLVYAVIAVILLGHAYDIIRQQEHWPFSNYPMWAR